MRTNQFKASLVFRKGDFSASVIHYSKDPVKSKQLLQMSWHGYLNVNCFLAENCRFAMCKSHNPGLLYDSDGQHTVTNDTHNYSVSVFLGDKSGALANAVSIIAQFPKGLVMSLAKAASETGDFVFSGFNVMLLDELPSISN